MPLKYRVVSVINNNAVLARGTGEQVVLMAKGIGFGSKAGDEVTDDAKDRQVFKLWPDAGSISHMPETDRAEMEAVTHDVVQLAEKQLGIRNPKLYDALLDHIQFAVDRVQFGLPIENPFNYEISQLYAREYETASEAVQMMQSRLHVEMGEAEIGFIALHLHSAAKGSSVDTSIRKVQLCREVMHMLAAEGAGGESDRRVFVQSLLGLVDMHRRGVELCFPFPNWEAQITAHSASLAQKIRELTEKTMGTGLTDGAAGFIALDVEKLFQSAAGPPRTLSRRLSPESSTTL